MVSKIITWVDRKALTKQIEFDIWDSGYVQGQADAKAGIIKLLEERFYDSPEEACCACSKDMERAKNWALALIKGETK